MKVQQASRAPFEPGALVGGKYRIVSLIGIGGVGRVYLARQIELDIEVAVKVLRPEMSDRPEAVQRFAREARASVRLHSERIARVLDVGTHDGQAYFVMEYMVGCSLLELRQQGNVDIATLCEFFIQACEGLADAHAQGVVHRDIKPENLFVVRDTSGWRSLKIFDFGISKFSLTGKYSDVDLAAMRTEAMMGTPHYISPEQIRSTREVDHRTDIWSLGAVMFEVLSGGILPFREERDFTTLIAEVLEWPHRSLLDVAPNVPERLAAIVDRCLEKDRELRYQTAAEVALDLLPLAPARARASAERAVSVMQAAGLMALNGDMESLRPTHPPLSDRSASNSQRSAAPGLDALAEPSHAATRQSIPTRVKASQPDSSSPVASSVAPASAGASPPPEPVRGPAIQGSGEAAGPEPSSLPPVASPLAHFTHDPIADFVAEDSAKKRKRTLALVLSLIACSLAVIVLLALRSEPPERASAAQQAAAQAAPKEPIVEPVVASAPAVAATSVDSTAAPPASSSADRRPAKAVWSPRPVVPAAAAKASATKPSEPPPPATKLDLRRER
jgi:serine/threonine protein kinase